ncbi:hypothetical protein BDV36DRAFT_125126 [Aspergillus pseudocaelatus]|uniref:Uncharacterized protein n=1 Tax=Aspergillus pseudocaelatus TaxID=1825620 RepID=A0ABQ6WS82_9EURO|nr:hypothetical protein BDV36DRAFT_125126 [Aspergillus pseudocaelatus]
MDRPVYGWNQLLPTFTLIISAVYAFNISLTPVVHVDMLMARRLCFRDPISSQRDRRLV